MDLIQNLAFVISAFIVAIFILVSVHEFGHFYVARLCGVKVLRFCIGFGKPLWSYTDKKGTEFAVAPIPLGGYVKMLGENPDDVPHEDQHQSFHHKKVSQRIAILAAGPAANFLLAGLIFWGVHFFNGTLGFAPTIGAVEPGSIAEKAGLHVGQEIVAVDGVATGTRMDVLEQLFTRLGETGSLDITVRGADSDASYESEVMLDHWMAGLADPDPIKGLGIRFSYPEVMLGEISAGSAAEEAGLLASDVLVSSNGTAVNYASDWVKYVQSHAEQILHLRVRRQGKEIDLVATPRATKLDDGQVIGLLGVKVTTTAWPPEMIRRQSFGFFESFTAGVTKTWKQSAFVLMSFQKLIVGEISTKNLSGPIGIAKVAGNYAKAGVAYYIEFLALLSITLGVMNLLPIPVLDGGHILYCLVEAVKGGPVSEKVQAAGYSIGLAVLAGVMVMAFYYDILRLL